MSLSRQNERLSGWLFLIMLFEGLKSQCRTDSSTRRIALFIALNLTFAFTELLVGHMTRSLGLFSDGLHMLFDCSVLCLSLLVGVWSHSTHGREGAFAYGPKRAEQVTGWTCGILLMAAAGAIAGEAMERLLTGSESVHTESSHRLVWVSVAGLLVNLVGVFAFDHAHHHHHHDHHHDHHHHEHHQSSSLQNPLMHGMFLHVLADTLGSCFVIVSSLLISWTGIAAIDSYCSLILAALLMWTAWPLVKSTFVMLMLQSPERHDALIGTILNEINQIPGVLQLLKTAHFEKYQGELAVLLKVQVGESVDFWQVKRQIMSIYARHDIHDVLVDMERDGRQIYSQSSLEHRHSHSHELNHSHSHELHHSHSHELHHSHSHSHEQFNFNKQVPFQPYEPHPSQQHQHDIYFDPNANHETATTPHYQEHYHRHQNIPFQ